MIEEPTTEQILLECCRELSEVVLPALDDETVKVSVLMLDLVLRNAALRSAHEIAWMTEEIGDLETYAAAVLAARPDALSVEEALDASIGAGAIATSLHLDDVVERYRLASEAFSRAMEVAVAAGDQGLEAQGAAVLERRREHETIAMAGWSPVGR